MSIHPRTIQRWRVWGGGDDRRRGSNTPPRNKLSLEERRRIVEVATSREFRNHPVTQIVPALADRGEFVASESTFYRVLSDEELNSYRTASKPASHSRPAEFVATKPNEVWSWDITYLPTGPRGAFSYLYMVMDVFSRMVVGFAVHDCESDALAATLIEEAVHRHCPSSPPRVLHADNGAAMTSVTLHIKLDELGMAASFSRPGVSDDNPFSEALFKTAKYRPEYPGRFADIGEAAGWAKSFVAFYNEEHRHSGIRFVTPAQRHSGEDVEILRRRHEVYLAAREANPGRWNGRPTRNWTRPSEVRLNPPKRANDAA